MLANTEQLSYTEQVNNLRTASSLLEELMPLQHSLFLESLGGSFDLHTDVDPVVFLDIASNGSALELLNLLCIDREDFSVKIMRAAQTVHEDEFPSEDTEQVEAWDRSAI